MEVKKIFETKSAAGEQYDWAFAQDGIYGGHISQYLVFDKDGLPVAFIGSELYDGEDERFYVYLQDPHKGTIVENLTTEGNGTKTLLNHNPSIAVAAYNLGKDYFFLESNCYLQPYATDLYGNDLKDFMCPEGQENLEYVHGNIQDNSSFTDSELSLIVNASLKARGSFYYPERLIEIKESFSDDFFICRTNLSDTEIKFSCNEYKDIYTGGLNWAELENEDKIVHYANKVEKTIEIIYTEEVVI